MGDDGTALRLEGATVAQRKQPYCSLRQQIGRVEAVAVRWYRVKSFFGAPEHAERAACIAALGVFAGDGELDEHLDELPLAAGELVPQVFPCFVRVEEASGVEETGAFGDLGR